MKKILVTGGYGFIGANLIEYLSKTEKDAVIFNIDLRTYAASDEAQSDLKKINNHVFIPIDLKNDEDVLHFFEQERPDEIYHLAAESHVCRSIESPKKFFSNNLMGTVSILEAIRKTNNHARLLYCSTDEIFGELSLNEPEEKFNEKMNFRPNSPYAASKACGNLACLSYHKTYGIDVVMTSCTNNFGKYQHKEKLIPKTIHHLLSMDSVQIYGSGQQVRDWIFVEDHCSALHLVMQKGKLNELYLIGGENEHNNLQIVEFIYSEVRKLVSYVELKVDFKNLRPTDDLRYAADVSKIKSLGWSPNKKDFKKNLQKTVEWYFKKFNENYFLI